MVNLQARNITKVFPGVVALDSVNLELQAGEVHCICGENGAGKSTLIKCLTGVYVPEQGEIIIDGQNVKDNHKLFEKVAYVPQEIDLFPWLTVAENLFMPFFKSGIKGNISQKKLQKKAEPILQKFNIESDPGELVNNISVSQKQLLQIARATVFEGYEILMLDEPTTSLTTEDTEKLFEIVEQLKQQGKCVVFISHKLEEVLKIADCVSIFRNGVNTGYMTKEELALAGQSGIIMGMTGHVISEAEDFSSKNVRDEVLLQVDNITGAAFQSISFELKAGEILGFAGLVGAGRSELLQAVFGYKAIYSGNITYKGEAWKKGDTNYSIKKGMFYLPEERRSQGILADLSIRENVSISSLGKISGSLGISKEKEKSMAQEVIDAYAVKTPDMEKHIKFLSGGNQQKVIIGRAMIGKPSVLIFDEPTKGIDIGTKTEIYRLMKKIAEEEGVGIILISSEMNELRKCSNRIISIYEGKKVGEHAREAENSEILSAILGIV